MAARQSPSVSWQMATHFGVVDFFVSMTSLKVTEEDAEPSPSLFPDSTRRRSRLLLEANVSTCTSYLHASIKNNLPSGCRRRRSKFWEIVLLFEGKNGKFQARAVPKGCRVSVARFKW